MSTSEEKIVADASMDANKKEGEAANAANEEIVLDSDSSSSEAEDEYEVSKIVDARFQRSRIEYRTVWVTGEETWEPEDSFDEGNVVLDEFKAQNAVKMGKLTAKLEKLEKQKKERAETRKRMRGVYEVVPENHTEKEIFGLKPEELSREAKQLYLDEHHKTSETEKRLAEFGFEQRASRRSFKGMYEVKEEVVSDSEEQPKQPTPKKKQYPVQKVIKVEIESDEEESAPSTSQKHQTTTKQVKSKTQPVKAKTPEAPKNQLSTSSEKTGGMKKKHDEQPKQSTQPEAGIKSSKNFTIPKKVTQKVDNNDGSSNNKGEGNRKRTSVDGRASSELPRGGSSRKSFEAPKTTEAPSTSAKSPAPSTSTLPESGTKNLMKFTIPKKVNKKVDDGSKDDEGNAGKVNERKSVDARASSEVPNSRKSSNSSDIPRATYTPTMSQPVADEPKFFVGRNDESDEEDEPRSSLNAATRIPDRRVFNKFEPSDVTNDAQFRELLTTAPVHKLRAFAEQNNSFAFTKLLKDSVILLSDKKTEEPLFHHMISMAADRSLSEERRNDAMQRLSIVCRKITPDGFCITNDLKDHPIHIAVRSHSLDVVKLLVTCGSQIMVERFNRMVPLDVAIEEQREDIFEYLITQGAAFHQIYNCPEHPARNVVTNNSKFKKIYNTMISSMEFAGKQIRNHMLPFNLVEEDDKTPIMIHYRREGNELNYSFHRGEDLENLVYLAVFVPMVYHPGKKHWMEKKTSLGPRADTRVTVNGVVAVPLPFENAQHANLASSVYMVLPDGGWNDITLTLSGDSWNNEQCISCKFIGCRYVFPRERFHH